MMNEKITVHLAPPEEIIMELFWRCPDLKRIDMSTLYVYCIEARRKPYSFSRVQRAVKSLMVKDMLIQERRFLKKCYKNVLLKEQYDIVQIEEDRTIMDMLYDWWAELNAEYYRELKKRIENK